MGDAAQAAFKESEQLLGREHPETVYAADNWAQLNRSDPAAMKILRENLEIERRRLGLARSSDGVHWDREPDFLAAGAQDWDREVLCDPTVELTPDGAIRVWFGGGDVPAPDHGIHGQIGVAALKGDQTR